MKKFLAVLVVFTLIAGVAFADLNLGGGFAYKADVMKGSNIEDSPIMSGASSIDGQLTANFSGENYGGRIRFYATPRAGWWMGGFGTSNGSVFGHVWWKPIDQFKVQIGHNADGDWGAQQIGGWGFNGSAQDYVAVDNWVGDNNALWEQKTSNAETDAAYLARVGQVGYKAYYRIARSAGFYPGFSNVGVLMSVYPADGVSINFAIPFANNGHKDGDAKLYEALANFHFNAGIQIGDIGKLNVSFIGGNGLYKQNEKEKSSAGNIYASFFLTKIENLAVDLGVDFPLPYNNGKDQASGAKIGLGVRYAAGDFGVKFRAGLGLPNTVDGDSDYVSMLGFEVLPYIKLLDGKMTAYLNTGLSFYLNSDDKDSNTTGWFVNPYITVPAGGLTFYTGLQLYGEAVSKHVIGGLNKDKPIMKWGIPIGFNVGF